MTEHPTPTAAERRAWYFKKEDDRARARYRNSLPLGYTKLYALLEAAESPWHAEVIQARIDQARARDRYRQEKKRAALKARTDDQVIRDRIIKHPNGTKHCRGGCDRDLPFHQFADVRHVFDGLYTHCFACRASRHVAAREATNA